MRARSLLVVGVVLLGLTHMRWGIGALAWVAPVPLLAYLRRTPGARARGWAALAIYAGYSLATLKITTAPIPSVAALGFALPTAALALGAYLAWDRTRSPLVFAAASVVTEFVQHRFTPFASWGAVAYTQVDQLALLQVAALVGMAGVSFVVSWVAASLEAWWSTGARRELLGSFALAAAAFGFGTVRLGMADDSAQVRVAAVGTDATFGGFPYPGADELARIDAALFARTTQAARAGAQLVAWNEAATLVQARDEAAFQARLGELAKTNGVELVAAYVVPDDATQTYANKYAWVRPDGSIDHQYLKHHPVPGEPSQQGTSAPVAVRTALGVATGAICYDFDFPALALEQARLDLDLAVVPSSDWRGIDPVHTQMASLRAIEGGFSLLRSTRFGLSAAFDATGRARAWESSFESKDRVMLATLPARGRPTLYRAIGDVFVVLCALVLIPLRAWSLRSDQRP